MISFEKKRIDSLYRPNRKSVVFCQSQQWQMMRDSPSKQNKKKTFGRKKKSQHNSNSKYKKAGYHLLCVSLFFFISFLSSVVFVVSRELIKLQLICHLSSSARDREIIKAVGSVKQWKSFRIRQCVCVCAKNLLKFYFIYDFCFDVLLYLYISCVSLRSLVSLNFLAVFVPFLSVL